MRFGRTVNLFCDATTRGRAFRLGSIVGALLTTVLMSLAQADEPSAQSAAKKKPSGEKATADRKGSSAQKAMSSKPAAVDLSSSAFEPVSPKREAAAVLFAKQHHAELAELLDRLKASHPEQYIKAIRELDRTRDKLEKQRERDADRYAILLREWQVDSRVRLLAARMTMSTSAELETELRAALVERQDVRLQLLTYDREKSKTRVQKMDEQIAEHLQNRESSIDREFDRIKKSAEVRKKSVKRAVEKEKE